MKGPGYQSWITYASNDQEGIKALILARSLRRGLTTRLLTIFISHRVSNEIKKLLEDELDRCITIDKKELDAYQQLPFRTVAQIHSWKLTRLKKFVFLDSNCLALKNSDELFKTKGWIALTRNENDITTTLLVDSPSKAKFQKLDAVAKSGKMSSMELVNLIDMNSTEYAPDAKYNVPMNLRKNNLDLKVNEINIICFTDYHPLEILSDLETFDFSTEILETVRPNIHLHSRDVSQAKSPIDLNIFAVFNMTMEFVIADDLYLRKEIATALKISPSILKKLEELKEKMNPLSLNSKHLEDLKDSIAIVGLSFRLPGANNLEEFWDLLINGKHGIIKVPEGRWNENQSIVLTENCKDTHAGFLNCPVDEIDAKFFGLSPMEVSYMDPQQRLTLQVMWEALEHAGINPGLLKNTKTGVFGGWWRSDYKEMLQEAGLNGQEFFRTYMGNALGTLTGRISHVLELTGPSIATESGCSTSIVAVDMACKSLLNEDCELALGFGVNLWLHPVSINIMNSVIATDGRCKAFDAKADGFGRAEGCSVLIMKRYSDAIRDGDRVWGLIRGSAVVQEGPSRSLGTPTVQCEALAMERALAEAGIEPKDVSFVEAHGTGTPVGDPLEIAAVASVYSKNRVTPLVIGSVKTNISHTEACSGIAGILKTLLAMKHGTIPPHLNFESLNPEIDLDVIPAIIPLVPYKWERNERGDPRIAGVSSFGITGTDGHVILQETPMARTPKLRLKSHLPLQMLKITAKSTEAFDDLLTSYRTYLGQTGNKILDICYTANAGRGDLSYRGFVVGSDTGEILKKLDKKTMDIVVAPAEAPKICFLFTGQGSQYPGMAKDLYEHSPIFKIHFDNCNQILAERLGISIKAALWENQSENLSRTIYSQTSIFCIEYCLFKMWESWGVKPDIVLGHSLGEFAAAVATGILTFLDALTLVAERSRLIESLPPGKMIVVKESQFKVEELLKTAFEGTDKWLDVAAINSEDQTVLAGDEQTVMDFKEFCKNNAIKTHILASTHAFHSRHMDPILEEYRKTTSTIKPLLKPRCPYISGMDGKIKEPVEVNSEYWVRHTKEPVRFITASTTVCFDERVSLFLEVGPQPVLSAIMTMNSETIPFDPPITATCFPSLRKTEDGWTTMLTTLGKLFAKGIEINWKNFYNFSEAEIVTLPTYPFQNKAHWFESKGDRQRPIHALVGAPVPNPSDLKLYQNQLQVFSTMYLKDHVIGTTIIMAGACFLEMCMVAGHAAHQCLDGDYTPPTGPLTLEDFVIEGPLALNETEATLTQTIVNTEENGETRVTIYSKISLNKETHKWIRHASATFSPYAVQSQGEDLNDNDTLEAVKARCQEQLTTEETYDKSVQFGVRFGPTFQNLKAAFKGEREVYFEIHQPEINTDNYILHPVIIDASFQGMAFGLLPDAKQLHVPFSVTKFISHAKLTTKISYIHVSSAKTMDEAIGILYDFNGKRIATFFGVTFVETTVATVMSAIEAQRTSLPSMYEDVWREQLGPWDRRLTKTATDSEQVFADNSDIAEYLPTINVVNQEGKEYYEKHNALCTLYIIRALYELGWKPQLGDIDNLGSLMTALNIQASYERLTRHLFVILVEDGYLEVLVNSLEQFEFKVIKAFPPVELLTNEIDRLYSDTNVEKFEEAICLSQVTKSLSDVISGKQPALPILFPEDSNEMGVAEKYYTCSEQNKSIKAVGDIVFPVVMNEVETGLTEEKKVLRILEVGAGTGIFTKGLIKYFKATPSAYEYTYTDISPVFFSKGEKVFENSKIKVIYKTLNIEEDPTVQGFIPHYYDMVFGGFVVHTTKDIRRSISFLRNLMRPTGCLILTELAKPLRGMNLMFGLLEGFWLFTDRDLRPHNCEMGADKWEMVLKETGFRITSSVNVYLGHTALVIGRANSDMSYILRYPSPETSKTWLLFCSDTEDEGTEWLCKRIANIGRNVVVIKQGSGGFKALDANNYEIRGNEQADMENLFKEVFPASTKQLEGVIYLWGLGNLNQEDIRSIYEPYFNLCKFLVPIDHTKLLVVTKGILSVGDHVVSAPFSSPFIGMTRALQNENLTLSCRCIDLDPNLSSLESMYEAFTEMFIGDSEVNVAYRGNKRNVARFVGYKVTNNPLSFPKSERSRLILPSSNTIKDLKFGPADKQEVGKNEIEVRIKAFALNFRDVLVVLKPDPMFDDMDMVGIDFSGVVTAVGSDVTLHTLGDPVLGINLRSGALPSHIVAPEDLVLPLPKGMTFNEGATLPAVASTVYVCLIEGSRLQPNSTILIHTGSGGVGLCAIQTAQHLNCNIVATAGSARKRAYLRNLGIKHVFNSRNTDYGKQIREALGGQGVDFVLNSLTGPGFKEATLSVCNEGARFVEMSKLNVWKPEEVAELRPDVRYEIIDVSSTPESTMKEYMAEIRKRLQESIIKPIPYVRFDAADIRSALTYLQKAKHIGKIICVMPEPSSVKGCCELTMPLFNDQSSYLITGGLGGIGIEVAKWMARSGAKHIILAGRNDPKDRAVEEISLLKSKGVNLIVVQCDISDFEQCEGLLEYFKSEELKLPTLRGIMHAAGVIADGMFQNQKWEKYEEALNPKIKGCWNLHKLTLNYPLEHFVMFSSAAGLFGSLGQSNHAGANVFLDCFAHYRNSIGLPATSINWGQWGQVGVAANLDVVGVKQMSPLQAVSGLETVIKNHHTQVCVFEANFSVLKKIFPISKRYLMELKHNDKEKTEDFKVNREDFWREYDTAVDSEGRVIVVTKNIKLVVRQILKLEDADPIDDHANMQELGMDSMMMIEMKNVLQTLVGDRAKITVNSVKDCTTIAQLSVRIVELVSGVEELPPLSQEELNQLIREDSALPENIKATGTGPRPSEIRTIFITGATGNLGAYILKEIFKRPNIDKVYCLMRGSSKTSPKERLTKNLTDKKIISHIQMEKIECVTGSLGKTNFGLTDETYKKLAAEVDCIFHLGVLASFYEPYRKVDRERDLRAVNVFGTQAILQFAGETKTKIIYHASATISIATLDEHKRMSENWPKVSDFDELPSDAYTISKFVGDLLMEQAVERGIPCKVFRFPMLGGDSKTGGNIDVLNNSLMLRMMAYMHLGCMPAFSVPFMIIPVDICAEISAKIFFNDETGNEIYNIHNPKVNDEQEFEELSRELGYPIQVIDPEEFLDRLEKMENKEVLLIIKRAAENKHYRKQIEENVPDAYECWVQGKKIIFQSMKLEKWIPDYPDCMETTIEVLKRDLLNAKSRGVFTKLGLRK